MGRRKPSTPILAKSDWKGNINFELERRDYHASERGTFQLSSNLTKSAKEEGDSQQKRNKAEQHEERERERQRQRERKGDTSAISMKRQTGKRKHHYIL